MDMSSLAASAIASVAQQTRDGFAVAALKIANQQQQAMADLVAQAAQTGKAQTAPETGRTLDRMA